MANYNGIMRTNYFKVDNVDAFKELTGRLSAEANIEAEVDENDVCFIGCYSPIDYVDDDSESNIDEFYSKLSEIIAKDDAAIFTEIGHEKLRYINAVATIVTRGKVEWVNFEDFSTGKARGMLESPFWVTKMDY